MASKMIEKRCSKNQMPASVANMIFLMREPLSAIL
jgi:hypothetical protein